METGLEGRQRGVQELQTKKGLWCTSCGHRETFLQNGEGQREEKHLTYVKQGMPGSGRS